MQFVPWNELPYWVQCGFVGMALLIVGVILMFVSLVFYDQAYYRTGNGENSVTSKWLSRAGVACASFGISLAVTSYLMYGR